RLRGADRIRVRDPVPVHDLLQRAAAARHRALRRSHARRRHRRVDRARSASGGRASVFRRARRAGACAHPHLLAEHARCEVALSRGPRARLRLLCRAQRRHRRPDRVHGIARAIPRPLPRSDVSAACRGVRRAREERRRLLARQGGHRRSRLRDPARPRRAGRRRRWPLHPLAPMTARGRTKRAACNTMAGGLQETTNMKMAGEVTVSPMECFIARRAEESRARGGELLRPGTSRRFLTAPLFASSALLLAAMAGAEAQPVTAERLLEADENPGEWLMDGRTYSAQRFSPLDLINEHNVTDLGLAWYYDLETLRGVEATPLMVNGVLYNISAWNVTYAHDAKTGELLWKFDPEVPRQWGRYACCEPVSRGLAAWQDSIIIATLDGRLISLDAKTGEPRW